MKKTLHHKGYEGSVDWDDENGDILYGHILHISDRISYHAKDIRGLKKAFSAAVIDYLASCKAIGKVPNKPYKGTFNVRVAPELHEGIAHQAAQLGISLNRWIEETIAKALRMPQTS